MISGSCVAYLNFEIIISASMVQVLLASFVFAFMVCTNVCNASDIPTILIPKSTRNKIGKKLVRSIDKRDGLCISIAATTSTTSTSKLNSNSLNQVRRNKFLSIALPWLYFMAVNMNLPNLPKFINYVINNGNTNVSGASQQMYGALSGFDAFFTFLSVNAFGCLSDVYGRKPFMMYSAFGLGLSFFISSLATTNRPWVFYLSGCLDGLSSCMFSQSQAYISDISKLNNESLSISLSQFQGLAIGLAFMFGIPLGGFLGSTFNLKLPLYTATAFCMLSFISIHFFLPESNSNTISTTISKKIPHSSTPKIITSKLNPLGAFRLFLRTKKLAVLGIAYFFLSMAQAGIQVVWINYLQHAFNWPAYVSAFSLAIVGLTVAILPSFFVPILGTSRAVLYGLLTHSLSLIALANTKTQVSLMCTMFFFALGASSLPTLLGYITDQIGPDEVGAAQGSAETVRTLATAFSYPLTSSVFSHFISNGRNFPQASLYFSSGFSMLAFILFALFNRE